jgi:hypothetical protein
MLSFIISNVLICSNSILGLSPTSLEDYSVNSYQTIEYQAFVASSTEPITIAREDFTVEVVPEPQITTFSSQIVSQELPATNSVLVGSAIKYLGQNWDCTMLVEQALRDLGYSVPDLGPMQFGAYGIVFNDPSQVQAGDIMMRNGHVAIYAGNGMAVHGGFGFGGVVYTSWDADPHGFYQFVRI